MAAAIRYSSYPLVDDENFVPVFVHFDKIPTLSEAGIFDGKRNANNLFELIYFVLSIVGIHRDAHEHTHTHALAFKRKINLRYLYGIHYTCVMCTRLPHLNRAANGERH